MDVAPEEVGAGLGRIEDDLLHERPVFDGAPVDGRSSAVGRLLALVEGPIVRDAVVLVVERDRHLPSSLDDDLVGIE